MKKFWVYFIIFLLLLVALGIHAGLAREVKTDPRSSEAVPEALEASAPDPDRFPADIAFPGENRAAGKREIRFEIYGGFSLLDPADLNQRAAYDREYLEFFRDRRYAFFHSQYGDNYTFSGGIDGSFKKIKNAFPFGFRFKYHIRPSVALSLGLQYLSGKRVSDVSARYQVRAVLPDYMVFYEQFTHEQVYPDYLLSVEGYAPMVGIHLLTRPGRPFRLEGFLAAGPLFAACRHLARWQMGETNDDGYWWENDYLFEIKGSGTGVAVELGGRVNFRVSDRVDLFLEGGYAWQVVKKISGTALYEEQFRDANAESDREIYAWEGDWVLEEIYYDRYWGAFGADAPTVFWEGIGSPTKNFNLDLSGFRIKMGISYKF